MFIKVCAYEIKVMINWRPFKSYQLEISKQLRMTTNNAHVYQTHKLITHSFSNQVHTLFMVKDHSCASLLLTNIHSNLLITLISYAQTLKRHSNTNQIKHHCSKSQKLRLI